MKTGPTIMRCFFVSERRVHGLKCLPSKRSPSIQLYCESTSVSNPNATAWMLNLGSGWHEVECFKCGSDLLIAPGDVVSVVVGKNQNIDAVLCTACAKKGSSNGKA